MCIQKILDLGQDVFIIRGTFINRRKGLFGFGEYTFIFFGVMIVHAYRLVASYLHQHSYSET